MGRTLIQLSKREGLGKPIFEKRFVVEICERMHTHYKNIRLVNSLYDWVNMAEGFKDALDRWKKRGCPAPRNGSHIELCRKKIITETENDTVLVNLNKNLYKLNEESIFSEGVDLKDDEYIHLKIGDFRIELTLNQFEIVSDAIIEAKERVKDRCPCPGVQEA